MPLLVLEFGFSPEVYSVGESEESVSLTVEFTEGNTGQFRVSFSAFTMNHLAFGKLKIILIR